MIKKNNINKYYIETVIVPHISTASIEFYFKFKQLLIILVGDLPNLSPMYLKKFTNFVFDSKQLKKFILNSKQSNNIKKIAFSDFFYTNKDNKSWKKFLKYDS